MDIGKKYRIESDKLNVTLLQHKVRTSKETKETSDHWEIIGYYATVKNALHALVDLHVMSTGLKDLRTVMAAIDELKGMITARVGHDRGIVK